MTGAEAMGRQEHRRCSCKREMAYDVKTDIWVCARCDYLKVAPLRQERA